MSTLSFKKVLTLPNTLSANCVYFVPGEEIGVLDVYVTDGIGSMARRVVGLSGSFSNYVVRQENEPTLPSAYKFWEKVSTGDLYYQTNTNGTLSWKNLSESLVIPSVISADILGNAATATQADTASEAAVSNKLKTARYINGTLFDGTQDITTLKWGNARAVTIGSTQKSVDGSSNMSWSLAEIGAAASSHTHTAAEVGAATSGHTHTAADVGAEPAITAGTTAQYWRGDKTWAALNKAAVGLPNVNDTADSAKSVASAAKLTTARTINGVSFDGTANITVADSTKLPLAGGTLSGELISSAPNTFRITNGGYGVFWRNDGTNTYLMVTASGDPTGTYTAARPLSMNNATGVASINGGAATATKLATARTLTIGSTGKSFDGSANVSWSLAEIGAAASNHTHSYLPLTGGAVSGSIIAAAASGSGGIGLGGSASQFQVQSEGVGAAYISYHRPGSYAINFGLDTDNWFRLGGWSQGINVYRLQIDPSGNFTALGNVTAYSDIRLKKDLVKISEALEKVEKLNGYTYTRVDTGDRQTGLVAQEVKEVLPEAVFDAGEHLAVAYGNLSGLLVEAIKELRAQLSDLTDRVGKLEKPYGD